MLGSHPFAYSKEACGYPRVVAVARCPLQTGSGLRARPGGGAGVPVAEVLSRARRQNLKRTHDGEVC